jgi:hypothetical protein
VTVPDPSWTEVIGAGTSIVSAGTGVAAVTLAARQRDRGRNFADRVEELTELTAEEVLRRLVDDERLELLLMRAVDRALRGAEARHREMLARLVASSLLSTDDTTIGLNNLLERALNDLEVAHLRVLSVIATGPGRRVETVKNGEVHQTVGGTTFDVLESRVPGERGTHRAIVGVLQAHGLVEDIGNEGYGYSPRFLATDFGLRLLHLDPQHTSWQS